MMVVWTFGCGVDDDVGDDGDMCCAGGVGGVGAVAVVLMR